MSISRRRRYDSARKLFSRKSLDAPNSFLRIVSRRIPLESLILTFELMLESSYIKALVVSNVMDIQDIE